MSSKFHTEIRHYRIFIIIDRILEIVYVGKTFAKDPTASIAAHLRGERSTTRDAFGSDDVRIATRVHLLESTKCTGAEAYKHVLAWGHYFSELGYALLMAAQTCDQCSNLLPETEAIYTSICAPYSLDDILARDVPLHDDESESERRIEISPLKQLNLRVRSDVIEAFKTFCESYHVTQSDGLRLLLLTDHSSHDQIMDSVWQETESYKQEIAKLQQANVELRQKRIDKEQREFQLSQDWAMITRQVVDYITDYSHPDNSLLPRLAPMSFSASKRKLDFHAYQYPAAAGCCTLTVDNLVYGKGRKPALFVLGRNDDDQLIKLRWYEKKDFVGISPRSSRYARKGTKWLVGCVAAKDGAMDLLLNIPLGCIHAHVIDTIDSPIATSYIQDSPTRSVNEIIFDAQQRKNH